jgi:hypothetical protein
MTQLFLTLFLARSAARMDGAAVNRHQPNDTMEQTPEEVVKLHYPVIAPLMMCSGVGDGKTTACVMAQAATIDALRKGLTLYEPTDNMDCACPVLRRLAIRANDANWWASDAERTEHLRPLIPLLLDSRGDTTLTCRRMFFAVDHAVRTITPMRFEFAARSTGDETQKSRLLEWASRIRGLLPITDKSSAMTARDVCENIRATPPRLPFSTSTVAAYASAASAAAAYADAYAAASVSAAAYAAAYASADAYAYSTQKLKYRDAFLQMFRETAALR